MMLESGPMAISPMIKFLQSVGKIARALRSEHPGSKSKSLRDCDKVIEMIYLPKHLLAKALAA
jgi:hypothetical protein